MAKLTPRGRHSGSKLKPPSQSLWYRSPHTVHFSSPIKHRSSIHRLTMDTPPDLSGIEVKNSTRSGQRLQRHWFLASPRTYNLRTVQVALKHLKIWSYHYGDLGSWSGRISLQIRSVAQWVMNQQTLTSLQTHKPPVGKSSAESFV